MTQARTSQQAVIESTWSDAWMNLVDALRTSCLPPDAMASSEPSVEVIQTHASTVILAPSRVYKLKKPKNFGFFDYSTPALRRHFCQQEVILNEALAQGVYLGVAPVLAEDNGQLRFGEPVPTDAVPQPGELVGGATVVDYAVVMVRLPETATLESHVQDGRATRQLLEEMARFVADFHQRASSSAHIAHFGELEVIRYNWEENFAQIQPYLGRTLDEATYEHISYYVHRFLEVREALFVNRVREGHIRDGHGDLRLQHLYLLAHTAHMQEQTSRIVLLDRIEFAERFRCADVAAEVAFLAMELDALSRSDLADAFISAYVARTGDTALRELLPFYLCYRACVRGKVASFQLDEAEVPLAQREQARDQARALFTLAEHYASGSPEAKMILVGGLMGTGKTTLARTLQEATGVMLCSSDLTRKSLAGLDPRQPQREAFGQGVYSAAWTRWTYQALGKEADEALAQGHSVLVDASFAHRTDRQALAQRAAKRGATTLFVECACPRDITLMRLARRWSKRLQGERTDESTASDGRPELSDAQWAQWEPFTAAAEPMVCHTVVRTDQPLPRTLEQALDALDYPRLACRLDGHSHAHFS